MPEAMNLHDGWVHAIRLGYPPNVFVTVNFTCAPSSTVPDPVRRISLIRDRMGAFLARRNVPTIVWIEVRENPDGKKEHVHWVIWVPDEHLEDFRASMRRWIEMDADSMSNRAVAFRRVSGWLGLRSYLLKGGTTEVRKAFDVLAHHSPFQGRINGPRVRVSHAIGAKARKDSGWLSGGIEGLAVG